jgi:molybdopterin converting factor small subunit
MTAFSLTQPEIIDRLRVNSAIGNRIADKKARLLNEDRRIAEAMAQLRAEAQRVAEEQMKVSLEEAAHFAEETKLRTWLHELNENGAITPVPLAFAPDGRTIRWSGGCLKLGSTPCKFVKALYFADGQQMTMTDVEEIVWGEAGDATIQQTASSLRRTLAENNFPYTVVNVINRQWQEPENPGTKDSSAIPARPAITRFALVLT